MKKSYKKNIDITKLYVKKFKKFRLNAIQFCF